MARATYHGVKDLLIRKDLYHHEIHGAQRYSSSWTGDNVANLGAFVDSKHTSAKNVNFGMGLLVRISVDLQNNLQGIYMRAGFNCFPSFCRHTRQVIMEIRSLGHLMKRLLLPEIC
jgi:hypothetical protein